MSDLGSETIISARNIDGSEVLPTDSTTSLRLGERYPAKAYSGETSARKNGSKTKNINIHKGKYAMLILVLALTIDSLAPPSLLAPAKPDTVWVTTHNPLRERVPYDPKSWVRATPPAILPKKIKIAERHD